MPTTLMVTDAPAPEFSTRSPDGTPSQLPFESISVVGLGYIGLPTAAVFAGRRVRLIVWARDYDGGHKAWVRFENGRDEVVPGSRVRR